jgi:Cell division control protein 24, OB domain 1
MHFFLEFVERLRHELPLFLLDSPECRALITGTGPVSTPPSGPGSEFDAAPSGGPSGGGGGALPWNWTCVAVLKLLQLYPSGVCESTLYADITRQWKNARIEWRASKL